MKKSVICAVSLLLAGTAISFAVPDKSAMEAKEKAAWQSFKDKDTAAFKKLVDKDIAVVYDAGINNLQKELDAMKTADIKSFSISDFNAFSDEKDVMVTTYVVKMEGSMGGQDMTGTYNAGTVWKMENGAWLAIFHTHIKQAGAAK